MPLNNGSSGAPEHHEHQMAADLAIAGVAIEDSKPDQLAFDRATVRRIDKDGRMHVALTNISKANVCPYYGYEIPGHEALGLDPQRLYQLLRDPAELALAAPTFNNIPLLSKHVPVSADDPQKNYVVGATGSEASFDAPYLKNSLVIWDSSSIAGVNTGDQRELSSAYHYVADMTPGVTADGVPYDGRMTQIVGNHVALVPVGRAGPDVIVSDELPQELQMKLSDKAAVRAAVGAYLLPQLAQDSAIDDIKKLVSGITEDTTLAQLAEDAAKAFPDAEIDAKALERSIKYALDETAQEKEGNESEAERIKQREKREKAEDADEEEDDDDDDKAPAMDAAAVDQIRTQARQEAMQDFKTLRQAEADVRSLVGDVVAMDSADQVYLFALKHLGIDHEGVHPSAYPALIRMAKANKEPAQPRMGMDASSESDFSTRFPTAGKVLKV